MAPCHAIARLHPVAPTPRRDAPDSLPHNRQADWRPLVHFHYTPTHASWLNQIEVWFSILTQAVLRHLSATNPRQVCKAINRFTNTQNENPTPFEWTKSAVHPGSLKQYYAAL